LVGLISTSFFFFMEFASIPLDYSISMIAEFVGARLF